MASQLMLRQILSKVDAIYRHLELDNARDELEKEVNAAIEEDINNNDNIDNNIIIENKDIINDIIEKPKPNGALWPVLRAEVVDNAANEDINEENDDTDDDSDDDKAGEFLDALAVANESYLQFSEFTDEQLASLKEYLIAMGASTEVPKLIPELPSLSYYFDTFNLYIILTPEQYLEFVNVCSEEFGAFPTNITMYYLDNHLHDYMTPYIGFATIEPDTQENRTLWQAWFKKEKNIIVANGFLRCVIMYQTHWQTLHYDVSQVLLNGSKCTVHRIAPEMNGWIPISILNMNWPEFKYTISNLRDQICPPEHMQLMEDYNKKLKLYSVNPDYRISRYMGWTTKLIKGKKYLINLNIDN